MSNGIKRDWYVSSYSAEGNTCAQTRIHADDSVDLRNSVNPEAGTVTFPAAAWTAFIAGAKDGEFDLA